MTPTLAFANALTYALQVAAILLAGLALPRVLGLSSPRVRLTYLRALFVACLLLPLLQPWLPAEPASAPPVGAAFQSVAPSAAGAGQSWGLVAARLIAIVLGLGVLLRVVWLVTGLRGLARLRAVAPSLIPVPLTVADACELVGVTADVRTTAEVPGPVTFGARRPVILLPAHFANLDPNHQKAIACHELLHVRRHDWLATVVEECVRSVFWFHPAVWMLIDDLQLSREQLVDEHVVALLGNREPYLDALLRLAAPAPQPRLTPAALFARKRHLPRRITLLLREAPMSTRRMLLSVAAILALLAGAAVVVVESLPLRTPPPPTVSAPPLPTMEQGRPRLPPPPPPAAPPAPRR